MPLTRQQRQAARVGALARAYSRLFRAQHEQQGSLHVCWGLPQRAYPRGGATYGDTYLTGHKEWARSPARIRHETVHADQWRRYGYRFAWLYLLAGSKAQANRFEIEAGLQDGGYQQR